jgi:hypothetical protein
MYKSGLMELEAVVAIARLGSFRARRSTSKSAKWMRCCAGECMAVLKSAEKFTLPVLQAGVPISL